MTTCRFCGSPNLLGAVYCQDCGKELRAAKAAATGVAGRGPGAVEHWLEGESGLLAGKQFQITAEGPRVGRHPGQNQVVLNDDEVSRLHARLTLDGQGNVRVEDSSFNGTYVNGRRVEQAVLEPGDKIRFALNPANLFVYRRHEPGVKPPPPRVEPPVPGRRKTEPVAGIKPIDPGKTVVDSEKPVPFARLQLVLDQYAVKDIPLTGRRVELGRSGGDGKVVIDHASISDSHAELVFGKTGQATLRDLNSRNGTYVNGERIRERALEDGDLIQLGACETHLLLFRESRPRTLVVPSIELDRPVVTVGRDRGNHIHLDHPTVSRFHAEIRKQDGEFELVDKDSTNGTFVNGVRIRRQRLRPRDRISVGGIQLVFDGAQLEQYADGSRMRLAAYGLRRSVRDIRTGKPLVLLDDISLAIEPGEFVGFLGPSGSGKTTLMDALNGFRPAERGRVLLNRWNLYDEFDALRMLIGYVPQEDVLYRALTPQECLYYAARLRLSDDHGDKDIWDRVFEVVRSLNLWERRDVPILQLSGGQRKRVSLGMELLSKPGLLFLDEPTAGQDPQTEMEMMRLFREIAGRGSTVVITTHLLGSFSLLDKVAVLVGGKLAYFGPSYELLPYFRASHPPEIYQRLQEKSPSSWAETFRGSEVYRNCIANPLGLDEDKKVKAREPAKRAPARVSPPPATGYSGLRQFGTLLGRLFTLKTKDWRNVVGLAVPPAAVAVLLGWMTEIPNDPKTLFILVISGLWFGCAASVREIVDEQVIYRRERQRTLKIPSYLGSKLLYVAAFATLQSIVFIVILTLMGAQKHHFLEAWGFMWLMIFHGALLGLLISATSPNAERALYLFPLVLIPQLLLAGMLVPIEQPTDLELPEEMVERINEERIKEEKPEFKLPVADTLPPLKSPVLKYGSMLMVARWGLEGLADLYVHDYEKIRSPADVKEHLEEYVNYSWPIFHNIAITQDPDAAQGAHDHFQAITRNPLQTPPRHPSAVGTYLAILVGLAVAVIVLITLALKQKDFQRRV
ncbi:MAG: FHA domain-containing protein [Candidatus Acidoferrales bacterium]